MTTIPTPWDERIAELETHPHASKQWEDDLYHLNGYRNMAEGYRRAKEEDASLVKACRANLAITDWWLSTSWMAQKGVGDKFVAQAKDARNQARAALAKYEGKE